MLTVQSCRALAADDSFRASMASLATRRACFEASADAWNKRADFLEHIGRLNAARGSPEQPAGQG